MCTCGGPGVVMIAASRLDSRRFTAFGGAQCTIHTCGVAADDVSACVAEVYAFESRLTRFRPDSELSRFNAAAGAGRVAVSPLLAELLRTALDAYALTGGLVNAAVLPALLAAGYDRSIEQVRARSTTPLAAATPAPPLPAVLEVHSGSAKLAPGCAVDLGGVGKGWLADRLAERLDNAAVNLGGDVAARGGGPAGRGWSIGLGGDAVVALRRGGVATSGTTARRWSGGHHLVDPRTGRPGTSDVTECSTVAADCATAEALSKAAVLLGSHAAPRWLDAQGAVRWRLRTETGELRSHPA